MADQLCEAIKERKPKVLDNNLDTICAVIIDVSTVLMDRAGTILAESGDCSKAVAIVDELKKMVTAYLSVCLGGDAEQETSAPR